MDKHFVSKKAHPIAILRLYSEYYDMEGTSLELVPRSDWGSGYYSVSSMVISGVIAAVLYFVSNMNSAQWPNLLRHVALAISFLAVSVNTIQRLMLIYAVPVQPLTAYPFLSGLLTLSFLPLSFLVLVISKRFVTIG
jgi:hypothetical protein